MKKILFIDDEQFIVEILVELFTEDGWTARTATDGRHGLATIEEFNPDVIVMDINMPVMDGLQMLQTLAAKEIHTPVIFVTGFRDMEKMKTAWAAGAYEFLDKPFDEERLKAIAETALVQGKEYVKSSRDRLKAVKEMMLKKQSA